MEAYLADLLDQDRTASTAKTRFGGLQRFFGWLIEEGEITRSPMERMKPPHVPDQPVDVLDDDAARRLLEVCSGRAFADVRDMAIIRLFLDSGMRVSEMTGLQVDDLGFEVGTALVLGKGRRHRAAPFGTKPRWHCAATWGRGPVTHMPRRRTCGSGSSARGRSRLSSRC